MTRASPLLAPRQALSAPRFIGLLRPAPEACPMLAASFAAGLAASVANSSGALADWGTALETGSLTIVASRGASIAIGDQGAVIGEVFRKSDGSRVTQFSPGEASRIVASDFAELIEAFWGPYIAIIHAPEEGVTRILRAPLGDLPCLVVAVGEATAIASDIDLLRDFGLYDPTVDWGALSLHLTRMDRVTSQTCLWGVQELRGGTMKVIARDAARTAIKWSPLQVIARGERIDTAEAAEALVSQTTRMSIASRAGQLERAVLMLSGGVDSSIVAAALVEAGIQVEALTLVTRDLRGDERGYARAVCDRLGITLHERRREVGEIDVMRSTAAGLPRPSGRYMWQETVRHSRDLAEATHAAAIFGGGGGDQVFCSLHSSNPVADSLRTFGPGAAAWKMARIMSEITQVSMTRILRDGIRRAWLGKRTAGPTCDTSLLSCRFDEFELASPQPHMGSYLPGQAAHSRLIAAGQSYVETLDPRSAPPVVAPLLSQPLVEACLRIPSWLWFENGLNRYAARQAFAADLPPDVIFRHSKGTPDSFTAEIFETWRPQIRELLADGELARQRVIDRTAVLEVLDDPRPPRDSRFRRVLQFAEAEAWAASWA